MRDSTVRLLAALRRSLRSALPSLVALLLCAAAASAQQYARPDGDLAGASAWPPSSGSTSYTQIDETTSDGATTYTYSAQNSTTVLQVSLSDVTDPNASTGHILRVAFAVAAGSGNETLTVDLLQGATTIATMGALTNTTGNYVTSTYTLTAAEANAITDYTDLRLNFTAGGHNKTGEQVRLSWAEFEVPTATVVVPTLTTPTSTSVDTTTATLGATITSNGGATITARGTVWGTTAAPTGNAVAEGGTATGAFSHARTGLPAGTLVYYRGYAVNSAGTGYSADGTFYTEPATQPSGVTFSAVTSTTMRVSWTAGSGDGTIVVMRSGSAVNSDPVDGTEHTANAAFGSGAQLGTGNWVVYRSTGTQVDVTGLTASTTYHVALYAYKGTGTGASGVNYQQTTPATGNQATTTGVNVPSLTTPTFSGVDTTTATLGATITSNGGATITARGTVWGTTATPTGNAVAEGGTATGAFTHARTSLAAGTKIYFRGYAVNSAGTGYSADGTFYTEPTQASTVAFADILNTVVTVRWTAGGGDGVVVLMRSGSAVTTDPSDGTEYTGNATFASGSQVGTGNWVVYRGAANSVRVGGLTAGTTYHVAVYEYAGSGTGASGVNYQQTTPATGSQAMPTTDLGHNAAHSVQCDQCHITHSGSTAFVKRGTDQETLCKTCHNSTNMASKPAMYEVAMHSTPNYTSIGDIDCGMCHEVHNNYNFAGNVKRLRTNPSKYVTGAGTLAFTTSPTPKISNDTVSPYVQTGLCQSCHTSTSRYRNNAAVPASGGTDSHKAYTTSTDCTSCHTHKGNFEGGGCTSCHANPQDNSDGAPTRPAITGDFSATAHHVSTTLDDAHCGVCHAEAANQTLHKNNLVDLLNPDTGAALTGFTSFTRNRTSATLESWVTNVQANFCLKCHDSNGATSTSLNTTTKTQPFNDGVTVPDVAAALATSNTFHHAVLGAGSNPYTTSTTTNGNVTTMSSPWNQGGAHNQISCFDCHDASGHGWANQRGIRTAVDFDAMEAGSSPTGLGASVESFCTNCHASGVYVTARSPAGTIFEHHGASQSQHTAGGGNTLGCMGCHGGVVNNSGLSGGQTNGFSRLAIHGGTFTWGTASNASGTATDYFMLGGWISGWSISGTTGNCWGGNCNHSSSGQNYTR